MNIVRSVYRLLWRWGHWLGFKRLRRANLLVLSAFVVLAVALCSAWLWLGRADSVPAASKPLSHHAFDKYVATMTTLLRTKGPDGLFAYVARQTVADPSFGRDCHPLLHALGKEAYAQYGGFAEAMQRQSELCNSGFTHGIIEAYYAEVPDIRQAITTTCPADDSQSFQQWQCYHGIGHGVMLAEKRDVVKSIDGCTQLTSDFAVSSCVNGVYMEHFNVSDHSGNIRQNFDVSFQQCQRADPKYRLDCYYYAPAAYITQHPGGYYQAYEHCLAAAQDFTVQCVGGVGGQLMKDAIINPAVVRQQCATFAGRYVEVCIEGAVSLNINHHASTDPAIQLCANEFATFQDTCQRVINSKKQRFNI